MRAENAALTLCRLLGAWVNGGPPETGETPDFGALFETARRHHLTAAACGALESAGLMAACPPETARRFRDAKQAAVRRTLLMDAEREKILEALAGMGVWCAPLKGAVLNGLYPQYGVREFADIDILFDQSRWRDVRTFMKARGYKAQSVGRGSEDTYCKPPVYSFEMHRRLFADEGTPFTAACAAYYENVWERLVPDGDGGFGYHLSDEDHYVYFLAHAYKHYDGGGTGLRTLLDGYLYRRDRPAMDEARITAELEKLGLTGFEARFRALAGKVFGPGPCPELTAEEAGMLRWMDSSGVYGTFAHQTRSGLRRLQGSGPVTARTRVKYLLRRVFPDRAWYRTNAPFAGRHPWAIPFVWAGRLGRALFVRRRWYKEVLAVLGRNRRDAGDDSL